ncbi:variant erythrocyte surface antigen-1 family protein [Babesia caballi]|uniref:Variant erythrocyte surface antigen-1 family protein n=1 Tax=Babesia caballi TaxID=5871 RepID=A0AAV4LXQ0_BABCB|nr:variant erythrocyte surface antigen-1 family protein [Babesia caballi]
MGVDQKNSLTDWPDNLKDVIDWFLRVGGKDKESQGDDKKDKLKDAVKSLNGFTTATNGLGTFHIEGLFDSVTKALQHLIGYGGTYQLEGKGIGSVSGYTSSYSDQATWNGGWDAGSTDANKAASIFLGSMPMVYYFVTYLYFKFTVGRDGWSGESLTNSHSGLRHFMLEMEFSSSQLNGNKSGSGIVELMTDFPYGFDGLKIVGRTGNSYEDFLKKLEQKHGETKITKPIACPLYTLHRSAKAYLESKFKEPKANEDDENISTIKTKLESFKKACNSAYDLEEEFDKFLKEINVTQSATSKNGDSSLQSSSAGAAVGGVLGTAALGAGAALATNVGGITTTLQSFIPLFK